jgi:DHA1 family bicyclomycin/chloramphenicol resistance-like MFS transporter
MLAAISCLSPFGVSVMAPLIPLLAQSLSGDVRQLQYLISAYVLGLALTQPFVGLISDHWGRRPVLLGGFGIFVLASAALAAPLSLSWMIGLRFIQAMGVSVGTVVARGIIRDVLPPNEALKAFALISAAMGFSPIVAPIVAGLMAAKFGVSAVFILLSVLGFVMLVWAWLRIPETRPKDDQVSSIVEAISGYAEVLKNVRFWGFAGAYGFLQGLFFAFLGVGATLFLQSFGISITGFSLIWSGLAGIYILGSVVLHKLPLLSKSDVQTLIVYVFLLLSLVAPLLVQWQGLSLWTLFAPLSSLMFISGLLTPVTMLGAVNVTPKWSGTAAGLSSAIGMGAAAIFTFIGASVYAVSAEALMWVVGGSGLGVWLCWQLAHMESR